MIAATFNCGCPTTKKPSLIIEPVGLQASYSSCFHSGALHHQHKQRAQRYFQFGKSKHAYLTPKHKVSCYNNRKNFYCAPAWPERVPSEYKSSILPQYSNYCAVHATKMHSTPSRKQISAAVTCESTESMDKQYLRSKSKSKLKKRKIEQTPTERIVSEIVKKGQPYKEIEAIFNDNRVIIRRQKESIKEEYDPPCECISQDTVAKKSTSSLKKCDDGIVFEMPDGNLELCRTPRADTSLIKDTCDQEETGCRTMTLYPSIKNDIPTSYMANERIKKSKMAKSLSLEENPNIFVLRIRNHSNNNDKKQKIDLEFRAPRPWRPKKDEKKERRIYSSEKLEKHEENNDIHNHINNDISEILEEHKEDTAD